MDTEDQFCNKQNKKTMNNKERRVAIQEVNDDERNEAPQLKMVI
jgi:hypothetical protein